MDSADYKKQAKDITVQLKVEKQSLIRKFQNLIEINPLVDS